MQSINENPTEHRSRSRRPLINRSVFGRHTLILVLAILIGLTLLMNGSVAAPYRQISGLLLGLGLMSSLIVPIQRRATRSLLQSSLAGAGAFLVWAGIQSTPLPFEWIAHPAWSSVKDLAVVVRPTISATPSITHAAIPSLIMPFLVFSAVVLLCQEKQEALFAWKSFAVLGIALSGLSIFLELFMPEIRLFSSYEVGRGSFNGIFVNRNTTAAFLGLTAFATSGWLMFPQPRKRREWPHTGRLATIGWNRIGLAAVLFLIIIALITTRSRAGVSFLFLCLTVSFAAVLVLQPQKAKAHTKLAQRGLSTRSKMFLVIGIGALLFIVFGEPVVSRMGVEAEDGRWCAWSATLKMVAERPIVGQGFGTFSDAFPQYRDPDCLGTRGAWTRAHNSYLELLAGMGLVGGLILLALFAKLVPILIAGIQQRKSLKAIPILTLGALSYTALHSAVDFPLQIPGLALYFAGLLGAGCAVSILERK